MPPRRWTRKLIWLTLGVLLIGLLAPVVVSLNFWRGRIVSALSAGLGRPVRAGAIHPKLFGGLGFDIDDVVVEEDSRFGVEPFIRMETMRATVALSSLWTDRMRFSSLVFVRPSLNAVRDQEGHWNVESLWRVAGPHIVAAEAASHAKAISPVAVLPAIQIEEGRINLKSGYSKTVFVFEDLDMEVTPPSTISEPWKLKFEGTPNRTDLVLKPVSRVRGQGAFGPFAPAIQKDTGTLIHLDLTASEAAISDLIRSFGGNEDFGVHGSCDISLHLAGTTSLLRVSGKAEVRELHRWDRLPPDDTAPLHAEIAGIIDLDRETLDLHSATIPFSKGSLVVQGKVDSLFRHPRPHLEAHLNSVPVADIIEIAKQFTNHIPRELTAGGNLSGGLELLGGLESLSGNIGASDGYFELRGTPQRASFSDFEIVFRNGSAHTQQVTISLKDGGKLLSTIKWHPAVRQIAMTLQGDAIPMSSFLPWARALGTRWGHAEFSKGNLAFHVSVSASAGPPALSGWAQVSGALMSSAAVNQPVEVRSARLEFQPGRVAVKPFSATLGLLKLSGSFTAKLPASLNSAHASSSGAVVEFECRTENITLSALDRLLNPRYRSRSFFRLGSAGPASTFFSNLQARGVLRAASFSYGGHALKDLNASIDYHDRTLEVPAFSGEFAGGTEIGTAVIRFGPGPPAFRLDTRFSKIDLGLVTQETERWAGYFAGTVSGTLRLASSGWNRGEILERLRGSGEASGANLELTGIELLTANDEHQIHVSSAASSFQIANNQVLITSLTLVPSGTGPHVARGDNPVLITGSVGFDRTLDLKVVDRPGSSGRHWGGTLSDPVSADAAASLR